MKKYEIIEIFADGYERIAIIKQLGTNKKKVIHFLEYDEYAESNEEIKKRKGGDMLEGDLFIGLVSESVKVDSQLMFHQNISNSSHIEAVIEICEVIDNYSVYAISSILEEKILIEFEKEVDYEVGERIFIKGSLEMHE